MTGKGNCRVNPEKRGKKQRHAGMKRAAGDPKGLTKVEGREERAKTN